MERKRETPIRFFLHSVDRQAVSYWRDHVAVRSRCNPARQYLVMILLNAKWTCLGHKVIATSVRDQFRFVPSKAMGAAARRGARAVVLIHNHPDTRLWPSGADVKLTEELLRVAGALKLRILDHIILGDGKYLSFRDQGHVPYTLREKQRT